MSTYIDHALREKARKQRAYDERRSVVPKFTPVQAKALLVYLEERKEVEALGTVLSYAMTALREAIDEGDYGD